MDNQVQDRANRDSRQSTSTNPVAAETATLNSQTAMRHFFTCMQRLDEVIQQIGVNARVTVAALQNEHAIKVILHQVVQVVESTFEEHKNDACMQNFSA